MFTASGGEPILEAHVAFATDGTSSIVTTEVIK